MRWIGVLLGVTFFCLAVGGGAVSSATAQPEFPPCDTVLYKSEEAHIPLPEWTYDHHVVWCAKGGKIVWWESVVTADSVSCEWLGAESRSTPVPNSNDLTIKNVGTFQCPGDSGREPKYENPWSITNISPNGGSRVDAMGVD